MTGEKQPTPTPMSPEVQALLEKFPSLAGVLTTPDGQARVQQTMAAMSQGLAGDTYDTVAQSVFPSLTGQGKTIYDFEKARAGTDIGPEPLTGGYFKPNQGNVLYRDPITGASLLPDGVFIDPSTGEPMFEPGSLAPGSEDWKRKVAATWDDATAKKWRKQLAKMGYLPTAKGEGVDAVLLDALSTYHKLRYLNGGEPIAYDTSGAAGGGAPEIDRLHDKELEAMVEAQYQKVFNATPNREELEDWKAWFQQSYKKLQRKGFTPDRAAKISLMTGLDDLEETPQGKLITETNKEKTELWDYLTQAAQITDAMG